METGNNETCKVCDYCGRERVPCGYRIKLPGPIYAGDMEIVGMHPRICRKCCQDPTVREAYDDLFVIATRGSAHEARKAALKLRSASATCQLARLRVELELLKRIFDLVIGTKA